MSKIVSGAGGLQTIDKNILLAICEKGGQCEIKEIRDKAPDLNDTMFIKYLSLLAKRLGKTTVVAKDKRVKSDKLRFPDTPTKQLPQLNHKVVLDDNIYLQMKRF